MMKTGLVWRGVIGPLLLVGLFVLAGCGSSNANGNGSNPAYKLTQPVQIPSQPGSIGGSIFTMAARTSDTTGTVLIDSANNAVVTLTGTTATGTTITPMQTTTTIRGGYCFSSVPAGTYTVSATASSPNIAAASLSNSVSGVVVLGNIPTSMVNLLVGAANNMYTFTGTITQDGKPAGGATVSADVTAHTTAYPEDTSALSSIVLSTTANTDGTYQIAVPAGGTDYYIASHSTTSMVAQTADLTSSPPPLSTTTPNVENLTLTDATTPVFADLSLDIVSATLPAPTAQASNLALMSKIAIARLRNAPQAYQTRLQQFRNGKLSTSARRVVSGIVENDLYWSLAAATATQTYVDVGVRGFNVYRATAATAPFVLTGSLRDPYLLFFFDNDPALNDFAARYYTVTSYAANGQESPPCPAIEALPLPPISGQSPAAGSTVSLSSGAFTWAAVQGALSYVVLIYSVNPTFNDSPVTSLTPSTPTNTSEPLSGSGLTPGTYWWSVQAFNTADPNDATAASYSAYQQVVVTN